MPGYRRRRPYRRRKNLKQIIRKTVNDDKELKRINFSFNSTVSTAGSTILMSDITAGDGSAERDGHEVLLQSMYARFACVTGDPTNIIRFILYSKKDASGSDLIVAVNGIVDKDKYTVYQDKTCMVSTYETRMCEIKHKFRGNGKKIIFDSTGSTSQTEGNVMIYIVSDSAAATHPNYNGFASTWFKDM